MVNYVNVKIWGELAGVILWNEAEQVATFEYLPEFVASGIDLAPIKMPLSNRNRIFSFSELSKLYTFNGMPGLLADVLPDRYGNELIELWLARQGRARGSMNPIEKLSFIGTRGMGALEFEPAKFDKSKRAFSVEVDSLVDIAQRMLTKREGFSVNIGDDEEQAMANILKIGTSAGGARPKAIIAYNKITGEVRSGQTNAPSGFEHYLIKLDGVSDAQFGESQGYGRVEMAYYEMAKSSGIDIMDSGLLVENGRAHFITKRFDRDGGSTKHHIQTWCALEHFDFNNVNSYSYEQLFQTMRVLRLTYPQAEQMFRRMVFNVLARNCDDHTKNFAFRLKQGGKWELAPAYDICHAYRPGSMWVSQHALSINGKRNNVTKDDMLILAKSINVRKPELVIAEVNDSISRWSEFAEEQSVDIKLRDSIAKTLIKY